ncbi:unnamed protein product [Clonostachys rosea f. rosea IK726]|uniref:Uncharacterized protein n=1 Tax=Clonostachys rosea f. rosea IK726 TaxID=1349383 RepID=A0ACA9ULS1_BIOOC|nr:unnamed protein product [Clonostachys rosea f. rosea IK726]
MSRSYNTMKAAPLRTDKSSADYESPAMAPDQNEPPAVEYPDGGTKAWTAVFGCFCAFFGALSMMNSIGVYQNWLSTHQLEGYSSGSIGWIFGLYNFLSFFTGILIGPLFDTKGPKPLSISGSVLLLLTYVLLGWCSKYWHFMLCFGILGSFSTCLLFTAAMGTVQHWFLKRRGLATGLAICGGSVGGITTPLVLSALLPKIGFAWAMRALALLMVPFVACGILLMRGRNQDISTMPKSILPDITVLWEPRKGVLTVAALFIELGLFIPMTYVASFATSHEMSSEAAYRTVTLMNVGSLIGRWLPGWLGDKLGRFNMLNIALALCIVSIFGIWLPPTGASTAGLTAFAVIFGIGSGSGISLLPVCVGQLCETENYGKTFTAVYSVGSIGSLIGVPLGGQILEAANGDYMGLIIFSGAAYVVAFASLTTVRIMSVGAKGSTKF